jgi:hypothetical protein
VIRAADHGDEDHLDEHQNTSRHATGDATG